MGETFIIFLKLLLAVVLGGIIGFEREYAGKPAGARTYALVTLGSTLFTLISVQGLKDLPLVDPSRIISQIIVGIGFIGAGLIVFEKHRVGGLTTASALWTTSAIGVAIGIGWYSVALMTAFLILALLFLVGRLEFVLIKDKSLWCSLKRKFKKFF